MRAFLSAFALTSVVISGCARPVLTREAEDARDTRRRCDFTLVRPPLTDSDAVSCAEWFIRTQGYTQAPPHSDLTRVVPEGIEFASSPAAWLTRRRGSLAPSARLFCRAVGSDVALVVFAATADSMDLRVVTLTTAGHSLRMQHSSLHPDVPSDPAFGCHTLARSDGAT